MDLLVNIRHANADDCGAVLRVLSVAFEPSQAQYTPEAYTDTILTPDLFIQRLSRMTVLIAATESGEIVGTIACGMSGATEGHLRGMAVLPDFHGLGIAPKLLAAAETELSASGARYITLDTTEPLLRAVRFYTKHGYAKTGRVQDFFGMRLHEYRKELLP